MNGDSKRQRLIDARIKAGFASARAAALAHGWPESSYRAHESGLRNFDLEDALRYGAAFGVDSAWILRGGDPAPPPADDMRALAARVDRLEKQHNTPADMLDEIERAIQALQRIKEMLLRERKP